MDYQYEKPEGKKLSTRRKVAIGVGSAVTLTAIIAGITKLVRK